MTDFDRSSDDRLYAPEPTRELAGGTPLDVDQHVRDVVEQLTGGNRPASQNAAKTHGRSEVFWTSVEPAKRELIQRVLRDLALTPDDCATTLGGLIEAYAEARLFRVSMFIRLTEGDNPGPITNKGATKALYQAYQQALDRERKLAQLIGLKKDSKQIDLAQVLSAPERTR